MSQEILYTSAPRGLKPGSRGFCTVVSTEGMAGNLAQRLESLSGYRHAFPLHDARSKFNPVNESHLVVTVGGTTHHVLSRVADAGEDYTGRSNKIAHHVALQSSELDPAGPAAVLASAGFSETEWDGQPRILPASRKPSGAQNPAGTCRAWQRIAGDAGWAGVLAESVAKPGGRPMSVIFPAGTRVLPLVVEAMSLLPPNQRWDVTFSTYFTKLPAGVDCRWRFLLDDSAEAAAIRRNPHATVIDLCDDLPSAEGDDLVEAARTGARPAAVVAVPTARRKPGRDTPPPPPPGSEADIIESYGVAEAEPTRRSPRPPLKQRGGVSRPPAQRRGLLIGLLLGVAFLLVLAGGLTAGYFWGHAAATTQIAEERRSQGGNKVAQRKTGEGGGNGLVAGGPKSDAGKGEANNSGKRAVSKKSDVNKSKRKRRKSRNLSNDNKQATGRPIKRKPKPLSALQDIRNRNNVLPLPTGGGWVVLSRVNAKSPTIQLNLHGREMVIAKKLVVIRRNPESSKSGEIIWQVSKKNSVRDQFPVAIAKLKISGGNLLFKWGDRVDERPEDRGLQFCILEVTVGDERELCHLSKPGGAVAMRDLSLAAVESRRKKSSRSRQLDVSKSVYMVDPAKLRLKLTTQGIESPTRFSVGKKVKKPWRWKGREAAITQLASVKTPLFSDRKKSATVHFTMSKIPKGESKLTPITALADLEVEFARKSTGGSRIPQSVLKVDQYVYFTSIKPFQGLFTLSTRRVPFNIHSEQAHLSKADIKEDANQRSGVEMKIKSIGGEIKTLDDSISQLSINKGQMEKNKARLEKDKEKRTSLNKHIADLRRLLKSPSRADSRERIKRVFNDKSSLQIELYVEIPIKRNGKTETTKKVILVRTKPNTAKR